MLKKGLGAEGAQPRQDMEGRGERARWGQVGPGVVGVGIAVSWSFCSFVKDNEEPLKSFEREEQSQNAC